MPDGGASIIAAITAVANAAAGAVASATFAVTGSAAIAGAASNFVIGALTLGGAGGGVAASIGAFAGQSALLAGISAMAPKPPVGRAQLQTSTGSTGPRKWVVGRCGVAGHLLTPTPMQSADGKIATQAYALSSSGPTGALAGLWFGDDFVTFQPNGVAIGKWSAALGCVSNTGTWTQPRLTLPSNHPSQWTVDHRAAGCATALFWIRTEAKEFQKNAPQQPRFLLVANQAEVLDPRTGAAATYSSGGYNPACVAYTYLRGVWKDDILIQGFGIPDEEIDLDGYSYWADVCDTNGWRLAGEISAGDDRAAVLTAICAHGGAVPVPRAGLESVNVSAPGVSVVTLTDDDWIGFPEIGSATEKFTLANQIIPRFAWESARFDLTDAEPIAPAAWLESDDDIERSTVFPLPWCTSLTQAGQIAAYAGYNDREPQQLVGTLKPSKRYSVLPGDCFSWQSAELGVTIKFRLQAVTAIGEDLSIAIQAVTETDAKHALALGTTVLPPARQAMPPFDTGAVITIADEVEWDNVLDANATRPDDNATRNRINPGAPAPGDFRLITDGGLPIWQYRDGTSWQNASNFVTGTAQITDTAGLGQTAAWTGVSARPANLAALAGSEPIRNDQITISGGLLQGIGTGSGTAVANSLLSIGANGALLGGGGGQVTIGGLGFLGDLDAQRNSRITISGGAIQGIGSGAGTLIQNSLLEPSIAAAAQTANWSQVVSRPLSLADLDAAARSDLTTTRNEVVAARGSFGSVGARIGAEETQRASETGALAGRASVLEAVSRAASNGILPDPEFYDADWWTSGSGLPAGVTFVNSTTGWNWVRNITFSAANFDFYSRYFAVIPGATYRIRVRIWNNNTAQPWTGAFWPVIHMPWTMWYGLHRGGSVNPEIADATNAIVAHGDTGVIEWTYTNPLTRGDGNPSREWQFRFWGQGLNPASHIAFSVEIVQLSGWTEIQANSARITSEETVRASADSALASRASTLEAQVQTPTTGALARISAAEQVNSTQDAAIAQQGSELVAARQGESNLAARLTTINQARADGDAALAGRASVLEARTENPRPNLWSNPSGDGSGQPISAIGWSGGPSGLVQAFWAPYGGAMLGRNWSSVTIPAGGQTTFAELVIPAGGGTYTVSMWTTRSGIAVEWSVAAFTAAGVEVTAPTSWTSFGVHVRQARTIVVGGTANRLRVLVRFPAQTVTGFAEAFWRQIKAEPGSVATAYSEEARSTAAEARITNEAAASVGRDNAEAAARQAIATQVNHPATGLDSKASVTALNQTRSDLEGSIATLGINVRAEFAAADSGLQGQINQRVTTATYSEFVVTQAALNASFSGRASALETAVNHPSTGLSSRALQTSLNTVEANLTTAISTSAATNRALILSRDGGVLPDPDMRDPVWWTGNTPGLSLVDLDGGWRYRRAVRIGVNGSFDYFTPMFRVKPGAAYRIRCRIWNNASGWTGAFWPLIHIPATAWYSLKHGYAVGDTVADANNAIVAQGDTLDLQWTVNNPTGVPNNVNREWQFRFRGVGLTAASPILLAVEIEELSAWAEVQTNSGAIATIQGAAAYWETLAGATGSRPARVGLRAGSGGSAVWLTAERIDFGDNTIFHDATDTIRTFYTVSSTNYVRVLALGATFGSGLVEWQGLASVLGVSNIDGLAGAAISGLSTSNGLYARTSIGEVVAANLLAAPTVSVSDYEPTGSGTSNITTGDVTATMTGNSGSVTYSWIRLSGPSSHVALSPNSATTQFRRTGTIPAGATEVSTWQVRATDGAGRNVTTGLRAEFSSTA